MGGDPRWGGRAKIENSFWPHPWKFGVKRFLALSEGLARKWGGLFLATSLEKIFGGVLAIMSFQEQSAVPRCAILSVGSTGGIGQ